MVGSIQEILSTKITTKVVSRVAAATSEMLNLFGMQPGGRNVSSPKNVQRTFGYDIFNSSRKVGIGRAPGAPAGTLRRQSVGRVDCVIPRLNFQIPLNMEEISNFRVIGGPNNEYDKGGATYIAKQQKYAGEVAAGFRKVLVGGLMRGKAYGHENGDDIYWNYTSTSAKYTIDYQIPSGNLSQLNMLGAGSIIDVSWANPIANIPLHLAKIDAAFQQLVGTRMDVAVCTSVMWDRITNNEFVISKAGTSNTPFLSFERQPGLNEAGLPNTTKRMRLAAYPMLDWIITDEGLELGTQGSTTYTKFVDDTAVWFGPDPQTSGIDVMEMVEGSEYISEAPGKNPTQQTGVHSYSYMGFNPTAAHIFVHDNALPTLYVPASTAYGTVVF